MSQFDKRHGGESMSGMGGMDMPMLMHMWFTTDYKNYPVLFKTLSATNKAQQFGIWLLLFAVCMLSKGLEFLRIYLEVKVWAPEPRCAMGPLRADPEINAPHHPRFRDNPQLEKDNGEDSPDKGLLSLEKDYEKEHKDDEVIEPMARPHRGYQRPLWPTRIFRNAVILGLIFIPEMLNYAMMLSVMTYTLTYFFAVAVGQGFGRFVFEKLSMHLGIRPMGMSRC